MKSNNDNSSAAIGQNQPTSSTSEAPDAASTTANSDEAPLSNPLSYYAAEGLKLIRLKGYGSKGENTYESAKEPIDSEFTKPTFLSRPQHELENHLINGGWLGLIVPPGYIALDVDKDPHSIKQALSLIKYRSYKINIVQTKNGIHVFFKDSSGLKGLTEVWVKHGYKLTYRAGGKNYCVAPPSDGRKWTGQLNPMTSLIELPPAFQPLDLKSHDDLSRAVAHQLRYCWKNDLLGGNEHIDMAFMGWLVKTLNYSFENVVNMFKMIYQDEYDENRTRINFERLATIGEATGYKTLVKAIEKVEGLSYLTELLGMFSKVCAFKNKKTSVNCAKKTDSASDNEEDSKSGTFLSEKQLGLNIIGFTSGRKVLVWSDGKIHPLALTDINPPMYHLLTGITFEDKNAEKAQWSICQKSIIGLANKKGLVDENEKIKTGIWKFGRNFYIISGLTVLKIDGQTYSVNELDLPIISKNDGCGTNILLSLNKNGKWLNVDHFKSAISSEFAGAEMLKVTYTKLFELVSQWNWKSPEMASYITAAVMLTPMQHAMKWRPIVYLTGERNSGKTFFYESIPAGLFSTLVLRQERTTAHSILQTYGNTSHFMILDEFEKYNKIPQILEVLKMCGWGGVAKSGTPGEDALEYKIKHMPWLSSTSPQYNDAAQVSRMLVFDLIKPEKRKPPVLPYEEELSKLGAEIIAALIKTWPLLDEQYNFYQQNASLFNCDNRMLANAAYMLAIQNLAFDRDTTEIKLPDFITAPIVEDRDNVLNNILHSQISLEEGVRTTRTNIASALTEDPSNTDRQSYVGKNYGVRIYFDSVGKCWLMIYENLVKRYLLKDLPEYKDTNIGTTLLRIPGAKRDKVRIVNGEGNPQHCITIPIENTPLGRNVKKINEENEPKNSEDNLFK